MEFQYSKNSAMKNILLFCLAILSVNTMQAQYHDSTVYYHPLRFQWKQTYPAIGLIALGVAACGSSEESVKNEVVEERNEHLKTFKTHLDDYLQFSPVIIAYGLDALGIKSRTDFANRTAILLKGEALALTTVTLLKKSTHELRPDGSTHNSFPSGHTAQAFAAATFLSEEYKDRFKWMPYAAYGLASSIGMLRMANNRHYISDVLVGAGIGILSMKVSYWTHQYKWGKKTIKPVVYF